MEVALLTTLIVVMAGSFWQQFQTYVKLRDLIERSNKETRESLERSIERSNKETRDLVHTGLAEHSAQLREHNTLLRAISERLSELGERTARIEGVLSAREPDGDEPTDGRTDAA